MAFQSEEEIKPRSELSLWGFFDVDVVSRVVILLRFPLPLLVLVPRHGRVPLHLGLPPRRDDAALQRWMR
jgi:hypothetical protein